MQEIVRFRGKSSRRTKHRVEIGTALFQKYTGFDLQRLMLQCVLDIIREREFEQVELIAGGNDRAYHLYESLGIKECGRVPSANKFDDGTYSEDFLIVMNL
jgi:hypothetical protein